MIRPVTSRQECGEMKCRKRGLHTSVGAFYWGGSEADKEVECGGKVTRISAVLCAPHGGPDQPLRSSPFWRPHPSEVMRRE